MPCFTNFQNDIFVSYAHIDDVPLPGTTDGWITTFVSVLKTRLSQKLGRKDACSVWIDCELGAQARISQQLLDKVSNSAVLLVILSPGYVSSAWCGLEREEFLRTVRERGAARVVVVEREPVEDGEWPQELTDLKVFRFWVERPGKSPAILGCPQPDIEYFSRMEDLCRDVVRTLKQLKAEPAGTALPQPAHARIQAEPVPDARQVYLALATYDLDSEWNEVKRYLDQAGIPVFPSTRYTLDPVAFSASAERGLRQCSVFVQLLSAVPFRKPAHSAHDYAELQLNVARQLGMRILQWRHPELEPELIGDEKHRSLLEGKDVRAEALEDFKSQVRKVAFEKPAPAPVRSVSTLLFVNVDTLDRFLADQVCASLERLGAGYVLPRSLSANGSSIDPEVVREDLETNLRDCDALIILYGNADVGWVRRQLMQSRKVLASRDRPLNALAVFEGPPEEKQPLDIRLHGMRVVDCRKGFSEFELRNFLNLVRAGETH